MRILTAMLVLFSSQTFADKGGNIPFNVNEFFRLSITVEEARVVGIFRTGCEEEGHKCVTLVNNIRFLNVENITKPQIICTDAACSPLERDIVTWSLGSELDWEAQAEGGGSAGIQALVGMAAGVGLSGGLEFTATGAMKIKPARDGNFQTGGNILSDSGVGPLMFNTHTMIGMKAGNARPGWVTGNVHFFGERTPGVTLMAGAIQADGTAHCTDENGDDAECTMAVQGLLEWLCDDQSRCADPEDTTPLSANIVVQESRFHSIDEDELQEALDEARSVIELIRVEILNPDIANRLSDVQMLFQQLRNSPARDLMKDALAIEISEGLDDLMMIAAMNSRFREIDLTRLERIPETEEVTEAIAELMNPLLAVEGETPEETSAKTKLTFCATKVGKLPKFNKYCER